MAETQGLGPHEMQRKLSAPHASQPSPRFRGLDRALHCPPCALQAGLAGHRAWLPNLERLPLGTRPLLLP